MNAEEEGSPQPPGSGSAQADKKPNRSQKTPLQKEVLEASYQLNPNPNEDHRRALGERIGLDEKQVSAWFINRRRKDKRAEENRAITLAVQQTMAAGGSGAAAGPASSAVAASPAHQSPPPAAMPPSQQQAQHPSARASPMPAPSPPPPPHAQPASSQGASEPAPTAHPHHVNVMAAAARSATPPAMPPEPEMTEAQAAEYEQLLALAKTGLPVPYREDGPPLGLVFDDVPFAAQGVKRQRVALDNFVAETDHLAAHGSMGQNLLAASRPPATTPGPEPAFPKTKMSRAEAERLRELERAERERRKTTDRLDRERAKEEARRLRELEKQRLQAEKEARKAEAARDRERKAEEKKREKEEQKRQKELAKAMDRGGRGVARVRQNAVVGPPDDEDIEWEQLLEAQRVAAGYTPEEAAAAQQQAGTQGSQPMEGLTGPGARPALPPPQRPTFPPPSLQLQPAFQGSLLEDSQLGPEVLMVAGFIHTFSDVLGLRPPPTADELAQAVFDGADSLVLAAVHTALLRLLQADMEDAHASGAAATGAGAPGALVDKAIVNAAHQLEAANAWGFDADIWRAHLNALTWPEVLREVAVTLTLPAPKKQQRRAGRGGPAHNRPKIGEAGEDLYEDQTGSLKLRLPARYTVGSVKAAAWQVLAECDAQGLTINEIARRIQQAGYRDLRSSRTPEASVAGALSRDVLFVRVAPSTFALASVLQHQKRLLGAKEEAGEAKGTPTRASVEPSPHPEQPGSTPANGHAPVKSEPHVKQEPASTAAGPMDVDSVGVKTETHAANGVTPQPVAGAGEDEDYSGDEEYDEEGNPVEAAPEVVYSREAWVNTLAAVDYGHLSIRDRMDALSWLVHAVLEGPTVRAVLDARDEEAQNIKKRMLEEAKNDKKKRQEEAAAKAQAAAAEATRKLEELQAGGGGQGGESGILHVSDAQRAAQLAMEAAKAAAQKAAITAEDQEEERVANQRRMDAIRKMEEEKTLRVEPLGLDRRHNRYWRVTAVVTNDGESAVPDSVQDPDHPPQPSSDPDVGRVYMEAADGSSWQLVQRPEQLELLSKALEPKGARESVLSANLHLYSPVIKTGMPSQPLNADLHAHPTSATRTTIWHEVLSLLRPLAQTVQAAAPALPPSTTSDHPRVKKIKHDMVCVLAALPASCVIPSFDRSVWLQQVADAATPLALRRCLGHLETAITPAYLSAAYPRNPIIHKAAWSSPLRQQHEAEAAAAEATEGILAEPLAWLPPTYAAIAMRLHALDAAVYYKQASRCGRERLIGYKYIVRPGPLLRPSDGADPSLAGMIPLAPIFSTQYGGVALAAGAGLTVSGRPKAALIFPLIPFHLLTVPFQDFDLSDEIDQLRGDVAEAQAAGTLFPTHHFTHSQLVTTIRNGAPPGRNQTSLSAAVAERMQRIDAMKAASGAVRSAHARVTQARAGREKDKLSKARSHKARKVRQSNLSKEWERQRSDDEADYGPDYDDGQGEEDELLGDAGVHTGDGANPYALSEDQEPDFYFYAGGGEQQQQDDEF